MDGTIYLDNELFDGTKDFLEYVKSVGGRYLFLTNSRKGSCPFQSDFRISVNSPRVSVLSSKTAFLIAAKESVAVARPIAFKEELLYLAE